jgi:F0F1-type ATP synthase assembly protein I
MGAWRAAALASQFGFAVIGALVTGVLIGQFLDRRLGTAPAFFLLGLCLGLASSVYLIYLIYRVQVQPSRRGRRPPPARGRDGGDGGERRDGGDGGRAPGGEAGRGAGAGP